MTVALPLAVYGPSARTLPLAAVTLVVTCVCWSLRRFPASLLVCLFLPPAAALAYLWAGGQAVVTAPVAASLMSLPLVVLTALRPRLGFALSATSFAATGLAAAPGQLGIVVSAFASTAALGLALAAALEETERAHRGLSEAALTDPTTGVGNYYALKRDFEAYKARALREGAPLLLMRWWCEPSSRSSLTPAGPPTTEVASVLSFNLRQGDAVYFLGDGEFVSLHPDLRTGASMASRVAPKLGGVRVVWVSCEGTTLAIALQDARRLGRTSVPSDPHGRLTPPN